MDKRFMLGNLSRVCLLAALSVIDIRSTYAAPQTAHCSNQMASDAEDQADQLHSWRAMFASFQRYHWCDDGAIAEGYSDSIATLLADHWSQLNQLLPLIAAHPGFRHFVLKHVDETMSQEQAKRLGINASLHCPANAKRFCAEVRAQLEFATH